MPIISIIVPIYNVENYIRHTIDSILAQSFKDFELILVDDSSPDNCGLICDEYAKRDPRIQVIHKENGGVCNARNAGLNIAKGKYITFCDGDDYWHSEWLQILYNEMIHANVDCVKGGFYMVDEEGIKINSVNSEETVHQFLSEKDRQDFLVKVLLAGKYGWEVWTRLFKSSIIQGKCIRFCETCGNYSEDQEFVMEYLLFCNKISSISFQGYYYVQRTMSMMHRTAEIYKLDAKNELSYYFAQRIIKENLDSEWKDVFPIIHFLLLNGQYKRMISAGKLKELPNETNKIVNSKWFLSNTKRINQSMRVLYSYYDRWTCVEIVLLSRYCVHKSWFRYITEKRLCDRMRRTRERLSAFV